MTRGLSRRSWINHDKSKKDKKSIYGWGAESFVLCSNLPHYRSALFRFQNNYGPKLIKTRQQFSRYFFQKLKLLKPFMVLFTAFS
jgi:hypothetical protein